MELTDNNPDAFFVEYPQISADGRAIHYWLVELVPDGKALIRTTQDKSRGGQAAVGARQKVTPTPLLPSSVTDGPAAADRYATRLIFRPSRPPIPPTATSMSTPAIWT